MTPRIAVVVPTRNRPDHADPCAQSILANPERDLEFILVDQSDDDSTERAVAVHRSDPRFRYVRTPTRGASAARNAGIEVSVAPIIAFTDDDCRVAVDWIERIEEIFERDPTADILFGRVSIPEELRVRGHGAAFEPHEREYQSCLPAADVAWGIGANMSVRRRLFDRVGTFDPLLGPGAPFRAGEECDLMIRALAAGLKVVNAAEVEVAHLGVRAGHDATKLYRGYGVAMGATLAKHVRMGTPESVHLFVSWVTHFGARGIRNALLGRRPTGLGMIGGMLCGVCRSVPHRIDRAHAIYAIAPRVKLRSEPHR